VPSRRWLQARRWLRALCVAALSVAVGVAAAESQQQAAAATHTVIIENMQFNPAQLHVRRGDRIVWVNKDLFPHTVTATNKTFDSGSIEAGSSWSWVAASSGEFPYGCTFHPTMKGTVKVQ